MVTVQIITFLLKLRQSHIKMRLLTSDFQKSLSRGHKRSLEGQYLIFIEITLIMNQTDARDVSFPKKLSQEVI